MKELSEWYAALPGWLQILSAAWAVVGVGLLAATANFLTREAVQSLESKIAAAESRSYMQYENVLSEVRALSSRIAGKDRPKQDGK